MRDGPLLVVGEIEVAREDGTLETLPRATLCRCGQSQVKPFCDNSHLKTGFRAPGVKFKIHLSPVRQELDKPMAKAEDPRRAS
jgi:CDGSH-type Zn-finger protein